MTTKRVSIDAEERDHLVRPGLFYDGTHRALCGLRPFPEKWYETPGAPRPLCPGCVQKHNSNKR